jgi:hypothetical protein
MFTKEEKDRMRQELLESFRRKPPPPKPTPEAKWQDRCAAPKPSEAVAQQAAASAEALAKVVVADSYETRRRKQEAKEAAEWSAGYNDPRIRYQRELDRFMEASRVIEDEYVEIAGFREPRYKTTCHKGRGDPDWGLK